MVSLDSKESIVQKITSVSGKTVEEVEKLVLEKKNKFSGLLTDSGAALMVARDLNIELSLDKNLSEKLKINQLQDGMNNIDLEVKVKQVFSPKSFEKEGKKGTLCNLIISDLTGETRLTLWHKDVKVLQDAKLEKGAIILLKNCYVTSYNEKPQLNLGYNGKIVVQKNSREPIMKLKDLQQGLNSVDVIARVLRIYPRKNFSNEKGDSFLLNFELGDETSKVRATAWHDLVLVIESLKPGQIIKIEGAYTKQGLNNSVDLNLGWSSRILLEPIIDFEIPELKFFESSVKKEVEKTQVNKLSEGDLFKELTGTIISLNKSKLLFNVCPQCKGKVLEEDGVFSCEKCGSISPEQRLVSAIELDDGSGVIKCIAFGDLTEKLLGVTKEDLLKELKLKDAEEIINDLKDNLIGRQITISGNVKKNNLTEELDFIIREIISTELTQTSSNEPSSDLPNSTEVEVEKKFI